MPVVITWTLRNPMHTGSTEMNGVAGRPMVYQHPQDMGGAPMTSAFSGWEYNQADYTNNNINAGRLLLTIKGTNSFRSYQQLRNIAQTWAGGVPEPWQGQQNAAQVFGFPLAASLQPSGMAAYDAYASMAPAAPNPTIVTLSASGFCLVMSMTRVGSRIGGGRSVDCASKIFNGATIVNEALLHGRVQRVVQFRFRRVSATYNVTIPAGGSVKVGEITAGVAYTIARGSNSFLCASHLSFVASVPAGGGGSQQGGGD